MQEGAVDARLMGWERGKRKGRTVVLARLEMGRAEGRPVQSLLYAERFSARATPYFIFFGSWYSIKWA